MGDGRELQEGADNMFHYGWFALLCSRNQYNIVEQFSSNGQKLNTCGQGVFVATTSKLGTFWAGWIHFTKKHFTCTEKCELKKNQISMCMIALVSLAWWGLWFTLLSCHQTTSPSLGDTCSNSKLPTPP